MKKQYKSEALASAHEAALGLAEAGVLSRRNMREFDEMCLTPVREMTPEDILSCGCGSAPAKRCSRAT